MIVLALTALLACPLPQDESDLVTLTDGSEVPCRVLFENQERVVYRARRRTREVTRAEVAQVQSIERSMREFLERYDAASPLGVDATIELALFAEERFLFGEARNLWIRVLTLEPEHGGAWTKLGGVQGRKGWRLRVRGRHLSLDDLRERVSSWRDAMELPTAHFLLRTNIEPELALNVTVDLERIYQAFYDALGQAVDLYLFDEVPEINLYSDVRDYPSPPTPGLGVWFELGANVLHVNASGELNRQEIMRRMTHLMIYNSFRRTVGGRTGSISAWAAEGLSQSFAGAYRPSAQGASFEFGLPLTSAFAGQLADPEALPMKRILTAGYGAFESGGDLERYRRQSYTLTYFLLHAEGGKYRSGFGEFLLSSYKGQGSATHLKRALDVDLDELEEQWVAFVSATAGR